MGEIRQLNLQDNNTNKENITSEIKTNLSDTIRMNQLGFEHLQSFSKLFKTKTQLSPLEFRQSFN